MKRQNKYGNTSSSMALATTIAIERNIKVLLISTSLNEKLIDSSFWQEDRKKTLSFLSQGLNIEEIQQNGVQGLERVIRSNKITPEIITDYTKVVLTGRLEVLPGITGSGAEYEKAYDDLKTRYAQIISLADKYYDVVIVDLDKRMTICAEEILKNSNIVVAMLPQRVKEIEKVYQKVKITAL